MHLKNMKMFKPLHVTLWSYDESKGTAKIIDYQPLRQISRLFGTAVFRFIKVSAYKYRKHKLLENNGNMSNLIEFDLNASREIKSLDQWFWNCKFLTQNDFEDALTALYTNKKSKNKIHNLSQQYFKKFDYSRRKRVTSTHISRRLHSLLRDILNARSTFDSFKDILNNFDLNCIYE